MTNFAHKQTNSRTRISRLTETVVNRIAAGEVVERPASVVKELMENAVDAGANHVDVVIGRGGKSLIRITDNGHGMGLDDLHRSVERHCTSKLTEDLMDIRSLGFRGEALPSIGSMSRLTITTCEASSDHGWQLEVTGGRTGEALPHSIQVGTVVQVLDLFFATPARLKFLKSDQAESNAITDVFKRLALAFPEVRFSLSGEGRASLDYPTSSRSERLSQVLGQEFLENSVELDAIREGVSLTGFAGVPTWHRGNALAQYFFVNGRPVKDKVLLGAVRGAYADFLPRGRHPVLSLYVELDPHQVDVNVHPAKSDVRFRDPGLVRGLIVGALKQALSQSGPLTSRAGAIDMMGAFRGVHRDTSGPHHTAAPLYTHDINNTRMVSDSNGFEEGQASFAHYSDGEIAEPSAKEGDEQHAVAPDVYPLGAARALLHGNYIITENETGMVIVDQHAAHERIVYERLKEGLEEQIQSQLLLVPEIVELPAETVSAMEKHLEGLEKLGLEIEAFGPDAVAVRGTPSLLGDTDIERLVRDLADEICEWDVADSVREKLDAVAATMACHGSVRSGRILKAQEMNALLRQIETTPNSGQCNHGRPTFVQLDLKDIERLFGR